MMDVPLQAILQNLPTDDGGVFQRSSVIDFIYTVD